MSLFSRAAGQAGRIFRYGVSILKWAALAGVLGILCGAVGSGFWHLLHFIAARFAKQPEFILLLPVAGLIIVLFYHLLRLENNKGTNEIIDAVRDEKTLSPLIAPLIFISTAITHLFGGSAGKEGAALQMGGAIGSWLSRLFRLSADDGRVMVLCGMAGLFAAVFGTPVTAVIFVIEFVCVGIIYDAALFPGLLTALASVYVSHRLGVHAAGYAIGDIPALSPMLVIQVGVIAFAAALVSIVFCLLSEGIAHASRKFFPNRFLRVLVGGLLLVGLTLCLGSAAYSGTGSDLIDAAFAGTAIPAGAFALKMVFTAITMNTGFKGGEIVPSFCIGATLGCTLAPLVGLSPAFGAAIGLVSLFCGVTNAPIASLILGVELFGGKAFLPLAIACFASYIFSGSQSLYSSQHFIYSKFGKSVMPPPEK